MKSRGIAVTIALVLAIAATSTIYLYVQGVRSSTSTEKTNMVTVIVPKADVPVGTKLDSLISSGGLTTLTIPADAVVQGAVTDVTQIKGQITGYPILQGEQISAARLQNSKVEVQGGRFGIPAGFEAVTLALEAPEALGGLVQANDHVTIYASFTDVSLLTGDLRKIIAGKAESKKIDLGDFTVTVVPDVRILQVDAPHTAGGIGSSTSGALRIMFQLTPADAQNVVEANNKGAVWLGLLPPNQKGESLPATNIAGILTEAGRRQIS